MMYILLTRPLDDAIELEKKLSIPVIKAPLLTIEIIPQTQNENAEDYTGLIVTSARALMIFSQTATFLKKPIWCVGHKTALTAKKLGFETIFTADNSAEDLYRQIIAKTSAPDERFLHICGESLHFDVVEALLKAGYQAKKCILYRTIPAETLPDAVIDAFKAGEIRLIPIYSKKTAEILAHLLKHHKLEEYFKTIILISCTESILEPLKKMRWQKIMLRKDLSPQTLEKAFNEITASWETQMPRKYFWTLLAGTAILSAATASGIFYAFHPIEKQVMPSLQMQEVEKYVTNALDQYKLPTTESLDPVKSEIEGLKTEITALKEAVDSIKQQASAPPSTPTETPQPSTEDPILKASLLVSTLLDNLNQDLPNSKGLWQQLPKTFEKASLSLSEKLKTVTEDPISRQELIHQIHALEMPSESTSVATPETTEQKVSHPWLEKIENFIGKITIRKDIKTEEPVAIAPLKEKAIQTIQLQNLEEIKKLSEESTTPTPLKDILVKAELRIEMIRELSKAKQEILEKMVAEKE